MTGRELIPYFLSCPLGRIFVLLRKPTGATRCVLIIPPFAEEMNKSRRQIATTASELSKLGFATMVADLYGTGDSDGEFEDATWTEWKSNIAAAILSAADFELEITGIIGIRLGCLLAVQAMDEIRHRVDSSVFWQPNHTGSSALTQFLRLRVAASMMQAQRETVKELRQRLTQGDTLEVAGYRLTSELAGGLDSAGKLAFNVGLGRFLLLEIGGSEGHLSHPGQNIVDKAKGHPAPAKGFRLTGQPFWTSTETVVNPKLASLTAQHFHQPAR